MTVPVPSGADPGSLLDTHALVWLVLDHPGLSPRARRAVAGASAAVSAASLYEVAFKVGRGRWPEMEPHLDGLVTWMAAEGLRLVPAGAEVFLRAGSFDWPHRDPFDRITAATAQVMNLALVSADPAFDSVPGGLRRLR